MGKKIVNFSLKTKDSTTSSTSTAIVGDKMITFNDDNILVKLTKTEEGIIMLRRSPEYELMLTFIENNNTKGTYYLKENNITFGLDIFTSLLKIEDNFIHLIYEMNDEEREFKINIGE
jgi:hypothetical protein